ncbi:TIGR01458 family HAD-type hydrolase [Methanoregula sp.]|jgi:HAD superfamily hydrolase (TIGR01458 family)|uniref:TIGR01458 family HAD-type hydrolase n=1 Tax=Methanoregula sp. TaxID=2052170 RepID=UPI003C1E2A1A
METVMTLGNVNGFLIDIDGVLTTGDTAIAGARGAIELLKTQGFPFRCVSNSTRKCRATLAARLDNLGFDIPKNALFTPPLAAVKYMKESGKHRACLLTTGDVDRDFESISIETDSTAVDYVIIGDAGDRVTYASMNQAFRCVMEGADIIALEKDRYWMASEGLSLSAGPFVEALEYATGKTAIVVGKPSKEFFSLALGDMGLSAKETVMIGDDIFTDIGGAQASGIRGILVKTGKFREDVFEKSTIRPAAVLNTVGDIQDLIK